LQALKVMSSGHALDPGKPCLCRAPAGGRAPTAVPRLGRAGGGCSASRRPRWYGSRRVPTCPPTGPATAARAAPACHGASGAPPPGSLRRRGPGLWPGRPWRAGGRAGGCWPRLGVQTAPPRQGRPRSLPGGAAGQCGSWRSRRRRAAPGGTAVGWAQEAVCALSHKTAHCGLLPCRMQYLRSAPVP